MLGEIKGRGSEMAEVMFISSISCLAFALTVKVVKDAKQLRKKNRVEEKTTIVKYTFEQ